jgi:hypothetical protein
MVSRTGGSSSLNYCTEEGTSFRAFPYFFHSPCALDYHLLGGVRAVEQPRHPKVGRPGRDSQAKNTGVWILSREIVRNPSAIALA